MTTPAHSSGDPSPRLSRWWFVLAAVGTLPYLVILFLWLRPKPKEKDDVPDNGKVVIREVEYNPEFYLGYPDDCSSSGGPVIARVKGIPPAIVQKMARYGPVRPVWEVRRNEYEADKARGAVLFEREINGVLHYAIKTLEHMPGGRKPSPYIRVLHRRKVVGESTKVGDDS